MKKELACKLLRKICQEDGEDSTVLVVTKANNNLFTTVGWLRKEYDHESLDEMPELFMIAEDEELSVYFMDYDEIAFIRW